jgi:hypothetical protein
MFACVYYCRTYYKVVRPGSLYSIVETNTSSSSSSSSSSSRGRCVCLLLVLCGLLWSREHVLRREVPNIQKKFQPTITSEDTPTAGRLVHSNYTDRICPFCHSTPLIGNEIHYLLACPNIRPVMEPIYTPFKKHLKRLALPRRSCTTQPKCPSS